MRVYCWAAAHVGAVRDNHEDAFLTSGQDIDDDVDSWEGSLQPTGWALVADGMGGHAAGEVASALAIRCLAAVLPQLDSLEEVTSAIEATNLALSDAMRTRPEFMGMGTTIAGLKLLGDTALTFNVGDSRIYHLAEGELQQISEDHVVGGYMLTKCLGGSSSPSLVEPFVRVQNIQEGSRILLYTDGVTDELPDETIQELLKQDNPAEALVEAAVFAGGRDNATSVVLRVLS